MLRPQSLAKTPPIPLAELVSRAEQPQQPQSPVVYSIADDELIASLAMIRAQASPYLKNKTSSLITEQLTRTPTSSEKSEMLSSWRRQDQDSPRKLDASIHDSSASTSNSSSRSSEIIEEIDQGSYGCYEYVDVDIDVDIDVEEIRVSPTTGDLSLRSIDEDEGDIVPVSGGTNEDFIFDLEL